MLSKNIANEIQSFRERFTVEPKPTPEKSPTE